MLKLLWKRKLKKFVKETMEKGGGSYEILLNLGGPLFKVWEVNVYDFTNHSLTESKRLVMPFGIGRKETEVVTTIVPNCAIETVLVNKIMREYPCEGGLAAYALEKEAAV